MSLLLGMCHAQIIFVTTRGRYYPSIILCGSPGQDQIHLLNSIYEEKYVKFYKNKITIFGYHQRQTT